MRNDHYGRFWQNKGVVSGVNKTDIFDSQRTILLLRISYSCYPIKTILLKSPYLLGQHLSTFYSHGTLMRNKQFRVTLIINSWQKYPLPSFWYTLGAYFFFKNCAGVKRARKYMKTFKDGKNVIMIPCMRALQFATQYMNPKSNIPSPLCTNIRIFLHLVRCPQSSCFKMFWASEANMRGKM